MFLLMWCFLQLASFYGVTSTYVFAFKPLENGKMSCSLYNSQDGWRECLCTTDVHSENARMDGQKACVPLIHTQKMLTAQKNPFMYPQLSLGWSEPRAMFQLPSSSFFVLNHQSRGIQLNKLVQKPKPCSHLHKQLPLVNFLTCWHTFQNYGPPDPQGQKPNPKFQHMQIQAKYQS